ncbi:Hypothetical protein SMAX5B_004449 [Scophthalmus maximus]|uniref:Uncharacterized protein n=1 Tax=Scophthalmus maximus TaxID=52904 RepID=A0A2U9B044_SCOMX|nr:Hypothetical protein SMAX5B_004449 [Scophthalmus maximus]
MNVGRSRDRRKIHQHGDRLQSGVKRSVVPRGEKHRGESSRDRRSVSVSPLNQQATVQPHEARFESRCRELPAANGGFGCCLSDCDVTAAAQT